MSDKVLIRLVGGRENYELWVDDVSEAIPQYRQISAAEREVYHWHGARDEKGVPIYEYMATEERIVPTIKGAS